MGKVCNALYFNIQELPLNKSRKYVIIIEKNKVQIFHNLYCAKRVLD